MKRFRIHTLMLLVIVAALCIALVVQERQHRQREAILQSEYFSHMREFENTNYDLHKRYGRLLGELRRRSQAAGNVEGVTGDGK